MNAKEILQSKKVYAIIGVSNDETKYSYEVYHIMLEHGYTVFPVNPKYSDIAGNKCYASLELLPENPEVIVVIMAPHNIEKILSSLLSIKNVVLWFPPECFSEAIIETVKNAGFNFIYDECPVGKLKGL